MVPSDHKTCHYCTVQIELFARGSLPPEVAEVGESRAATRRARLPCSWWLGERDGVGVTPTNMRLICAANALSDGLQHSDRAYDRVAEFMVS
jgi:hypothetical protein